VCRLVPFDGTGAGATPRDPGCHVQVGAMDRWELMDHEAAVWPMADRQHRHLSAQVDLVEHLDLVVTFPSSLHEGAQASGDVC
jgi:hypothetical protein